MKIEELSSKTQNKYATVTLTYEEIHQMTDGLFHVLKTNPEYKEIQAKCKTLFDLVKHGAIMPETVDKLHSVKETGRVKKTNDCI